MFTKSTFLITLTMFLVMGANTIVFTNSSQPNPGNTGAPGENTCARSGCHSGSAIATALIGFDTAPTGRLANGYTPNTDYNLFVNVNALPPNGNSPRYGFEITALDGNNNKAGSFTITNANLTSLSTSTGREYVGHKNANSSAAWTFKWTAPASGTGDVKFYIAANIANNNNSDSGDKIYTQAFTITESTVNPCANFSTFISTPGNVTSFCTGQTLALSANIGGGGANATYLWSNGGPNQTETVSNAGNYTVTVTQGGCTATSSVDITSIAAGVADFSIVLNNNEIVINNNSTGLDGNYTWDFGNGDGFADNSASFTYTYTANGTYTVVLTFTDVCGNTQTFDLPVTITSIPTVGVNETSLAQILTIYPNPIGSQASININGHNGTSYQFVMVDVTGKTVRNLQGVAGTPMSFNRDGLQSGIYFYNITLAGETAQGKILID